MTIFRFSIRERLWGLHVLSQAVSGPREPRLERKHHLQDLSLAEQVQTTHVNTHMAFPRKQTGELAADQIRWEDTEKS